MKVSLSSICLIIVMIFGFETHAQSYLELIRQKFHQINGKEDIEAIVNMKTLTASSEDQHTILAYKAVCLSMMAQYEFLPHAKYRQFQEGVEMLENAIKLQFSVENIYLRLLLQLETPKILKYHENIIEDLKFFEQNILKAKLPVFYKKRMINSLVKANNQNYDLSGLKNIHISTHGH